MSSVFTENNIGIEIHYFESDLNNLMIWLTYQQKPYFVTVDNYHNQLQQMKCKYADEIEKAILKFLNQDNS
jgi:hypothetical protein